MPVKPRAATFCLGLWVMGTVCISVVATQNFYTIDRLLADGGHPSFAEGVGQLGAPAARDLLRYLSSELNRLFFAYWNLFQIPLGGVTLWLVLGLSGDRRLRWMVGAMLAIALALTTVVTPPIVSIGRGLDFLGVATVAANALFAAITGISIASAAIFSKIAVPEMVRQGYTARFAVGLTAGSSVLGMLIPPSLLLIIYGVIAEVSIGGLFIAAVIPGILLALAFAAGVVLMAWLTPGFVGHVDRARGDAGSMSWLEVLLGILPVFVLIVLVLGGIYGGVFTPTEAGAAGAFAAMCIALVKRRLDWPKLWEVMRETGQVSVTILFLIIAASTFSRMLTLTELPQDVAMFLGGTGLGMFGFLAAYLLLLIILGTVLDSTSILLILLPLALPVVGELGGNLIWFGIVTVVGIEIGLMTPPLGLSVYVIKSSLDDESISLGTIFAGAFPFVLITLAITILLMAFPELSLWLLGL